MLTLKKLILTEDSLVAYRDRVRAWGTLVVTNGCFDLLHAGHIEYLRQAKELGTQLLVGLNSDRSVQALKGPGRPLNSERDRAVVLNELQCVDAIYIFDEDRATKFLELAKPNIWAKGGDYRLESLDLHERLAVAAADGKIVIIPMVRGLSTTNILERFRSSAAEPASLKRLVVGSTPTGTANL